MSRAKFQIESSQYEKSFSLSQSSISLSIQNKRKGISKKNKKNFKKKDYMFSHTVCIAAKEANGQYKIITHRECKIMSTKSTNISKMSDDYARKINKEVVLKYENLETKQELQKQIKKQKFQKNLSIQSPKDNSLSNCPTQVYPYWFPAIHSLSCISLRYQQIP